MKNLCVIVIFVLLIPCTANGQEHFIAGDILYGTFNMRSLKNLQQEFLDHSDLPYVVISEFPSYIGFSFLLGYPISKRCAIGPRFQFISTGGRLDYGDYSGHIRQDQLLKGLSLGVYFQYLLEQSEVWPVYFTFTAGCMYTDLKFISEAVVGTSSVTDKVNFYSINYTFNPSVLVKRKLNNHFMGGISVGYEFQMHNKLKPDGNNKAYLQDNKGNLVKAAWDGLRLSAGITYTW